MHAPAMMAVSASVPFYASFMAEDEARFSKDLVTVVYFSSVGLLIALSALLDDSFALTSWFGLQVGPLDIGLL